MLRASYLVGTLCLALTSTVGCCTTMGPTGCSSGMGTCGPSCDGMISCDSGPTYGLGALASFASCRGACGEVYVDEWINEPPVADNCGYECGGCGHCSSCQPIRNALKMLWGRPYQTACSSGLCGPSCGGCDSCDSSGFEPSGISGDHYMAPMAGSGSNCNCGKSHDPVPGSIMPTPSAIPDVMPLEPVPSEASPLVPTPAPAVENASAMRLNPARRRAIRTASATR